MRFSIFYQVTDAYNTAWNIGINPYNMFAKCEGGVPPPLAVGDAYDSV